MNAKLRALGQARDQLLDRIKQVLVADGRVNASWLSGSYGRGEADEWSDSNTMARIAATRAFAEGELSPKQNA